MDGRPSMNRYLNVCPIHRALGIAAMIGSATLLEAQSTGELVGKVLRASAPAKAIAGATVEIAPVSLRAQTDSAGRFRLRDVPKGRMRVVVRALGFAPDTADVEFEPNLTVVRDFLLADEPVELAGVRVTGEAPAVGSAAIRDFEERRRRGIGRFLDRSQISRFDNNRTGSLLRTVAGVDVKVGGSKAWISGGRALGSGRGAFSQVRKEDVLDRQDIAAGAPLACYMDVYVDGALVYNSSVLTNRRAQEASPLFDVNSIPPSEIEAIEVYTGSAQIPPQYNKTGGGCGVLLIWTRVR